MLTHIIVVEEVARHGHRIDGFNETCDALLGKAFYCMPQVGLKCSQVGTLIMLTAPTTRHDMQSDVTCR